MITKLLIKTVGGDNPNFQDNLLRTKLGAATGIVGIIANLSLALTKGAIGYLSGSISIVADALNNLTDTASSLVTVVGIHLSGKASDEDHPYGHGRGEYIATLVVASIIFFVGLTLLKSSVENIINPKPIEFSWITFGILILSIGVKYWMYHFYKGISEKIQSSPLKASSIDSLSDVLVTSVVVIAFVLSNFTNFPIDGVGGIFVAGFILKTGYELISEMIDELLGRGHSNELEKELEDIFKLREEIVGTHDLNIHRYGPRSKYATIDAVIRGDTDVSEIHDIFTEIEHEVMDKYGLLLTIHMDVLKDETKIEKKLMSMLDEFMELNDSVLSYHDEAVIKLNGRYHVIVHVVTDGKKIITNHDEQELEDKLKAFLYEEFKDSDYDIIIDKKYEEV